MKWDRQNGESIKAYKAFCVYRDLGDERSLQEVCNYFSRQEGVKKASKERQKPEGRFYQWSSKYRWVSRSEAYDEYLESLERKEREKKYKELLRKKEQVGRSLQNEFVVFMKDHKDTKKVKDIHSATDLFVKGVALEEQALNINPLEDKVNAMMKEYREFKEGVMKAIIKRYGPHEAEEFLREIQSEIL